jgi:hypothetical protein
MISGIIWNGMFMAGCLWPDGFPFGTAPGQLGMVAQQQSWKVLDWLGFERI